MNAREFRREHGDPAEWSSAEFEDYEHIAEVDDWLRRHPQAALAAARASRTPHTNSPAAVRSTT